MSEHIDFEAPVCTDRLQITAYFLYRVRKVFDLTLTEAALIYGFKYTTYQKIETSILSITYKQLLVVLQQLKISQSQLEEFQILIEKYLLSVGYVVTAELSDQMGLSSFEKEENIRSFDKKLGFKKVEEINKVIREKIYIEL